MKKLSLHYKISIFHDVKTKFTLKYYLYKSWGWFFRDFIVILNRIWNNAYLNTKKKPIKWLLLSLRNYEFELILKNDITNFSWYNQTFIYIFVFLYIRVLEKSCVDRLNINHRISSNCKRFSFEVVFKIRFIYIIITHILYQYTLTIFFYQINLSSYSMSEAQLV